MLRCPVCKQPLLKQDAALRCESRHSFDVAKEGYVNLLLSHKKKSKSPGDNRAMLRARREFLELGYYQPVNDALYQLLQPANGDEILDIGCGEGYFTAELQHHSGAKVSGLDVSRDAIQMAAKKYRDCSFYVGSSQELPFVDDSFAGVFNINAPINAAEIVRILRPGGLYLRVFPGEEHLFDLKRLIYSEPRLHPVDIMPVEGMQHIKRDTAEFSFEAKGDAVFNLLMMTPYYWHATEQQQKDIKAMTKLALEARFVFDLYRKAEL